MKTTPLRHLVLLFFSSFSFSSSNLVAWAAPDNTIEQDETTAATITDRLRTTSPSLPPQQPETNYPAGASDIIPSKQNPLPADLMPFNVAPPSPPSPPSSSHTHTPPTPHTTTTTNNNNPAAAARPRSFAPQPPTPPPAPISLSPEEFEQQVYTKKMELFNMDMERGGFYDMGREEADSEDDPQNNAGGPPQPPQQQPMPSPSQAADKLYSKDMERGGVYDMGPEAIHAQEVGAENLPQPFPLPLVQAGDKATGSFETLASSSPPLSSGGNVDEEDTKKSVLDDVTVMAGAAGTNARTALRSVGAAATALARVGIAAVEKKKGHGNGAIASPAVLNVPRPHLAILRAVFVAYKRIGAMNVDFNLPISPYDRFGSAVAVLLPVGDLDHDATSIELVVGAPGDRTCKKKAGAVYILFLAGFGSMIRNYHKIVPGEGALKGECFKFAGFGSAVASLGDLNGDGYADIAVGSPFQEETGVVYILFLGYGGVVSHFTKIGGAHKGIVYSKWGNPDFGNPCYTPPLTLGDEFGCSVAMIGDLNHDGIPDLAVGACGDTDVKKGGVYPTESCVGAGAVYILFMNRDGSVKYHRKISARYGNLLIGPQPGDRFGASIALVGDVNHNGFPEIAVGAPMSDASGKNVGQVYVLELLPSGDVKRFQIISTAYASAYTGTPYGPRYSYFSAPLASYDYFGSAVAAMDIDRDGFCDLLVGSRGFNQRAWDEGAGFACYMDGGLALTGWEQAASQSGVLVPVQPGEQFGAALAVWDNPGSFSLLFVGAPGECSDATGGSVYVMRVQPVIG